MNNLLLIVPIVSSIALLIMFTNQRNLLREEMANRKNVRFRMALYRGIASMMLIAGLVAVAIDSKEIAFMDTVIKSFTWGLPFGILLFGIMTVIYRLRDDLQESKLKHSPRLRVIDANNSNSENKTSILDEEKELDLEDSTRPHVEIRA